MSVKKISSVSLEVLPTSRPVWLLVPLVRDPWTTTGHQWKCVFCDQLGNACKFHAWYWLQQPIACCSETPPCNCYGLQSPVVSMEYTDMSAKTSTAVVTLRKLACNRLLTVHAGCIFFPPGLCDWGITQEVLMCAQSSR